jgi:hypothetical protein
MIAIEFNYNIHEKEILTISSIYKEWRRYLKGIEYLILVFLDHKNLEYFTITKELNSHQTRWIQELANYDFKIVYHPRNFN